MSELKTYSGELKDGMLCTDVVGSNDKMYFWESHFTKPPAEVMINREWQLYKPQPKKVWGIPEVGQSWYAVCQDRILGWTGVEMPWRDGMTHPVLLSKEHAEQHAKALNMRDEFRLLSDVPLDNVKQWFINSRRVIDSGSFLFTKLDLAIFGVVFNTREQAEQALAKFPQIHIASKIIQFGFHGIVEEML